MIIVRLVGGLANQMGIYAAGRALAEHTGMPLKLDITELAKDPLRQYDLHHLDINAEIATKDDIRRVSGKSRFSIINKVRKKYYSLFNKRQPARIYREGSLFFDKMFFSLEPPAYLIGNFPSLHYYLPVFPLLQQEFSLSSALSRESTGWLSRIQASTSVALHVRRGDYVSNPKATAFHGVLGLDYYRNAIAEMRTHVGHDAEFFIFSDDHAWVKANLDADNHCHFVDCNDAENGYQDYWLMRQCRHHIVANSGFSRWAALLGKHPEQRVIRPHNWTSAGDLRDEDIGPATWMRVGN